MAVNLSKGGKISLQKCAGEGAAPLEKLMVGLGWDCNQFDGGAEFDLDCSVFMVGADGKTKEEGFIFYNNKVGAGVEHMGDNKTGQGDGDDEVVNITLSQIPADIQKLSFTVTIHEADVRNQNFGMVSNSYIRVVDQNTGNEILKYDLGEDYSTETAIVVAEIYRHNNEWKFAAIGSGFAGGLEALCRHNGLDV